jgi:hypothetical protein
MPSSGSSADAAGLRPGRADEASGASRFVAQPEIHKNQSIRLRKIIRFADDLSSLGRTEFEIGMTESGYQSAG